MFVVIAEEICLSSSELLNACIALLPVRVRVHVCMSIVVVGAVTKRVVWHVCVRVLQIVASLITLYLQTLLPLQLLLPLPMHRT